VSPAIARQPTPSIDQRGNVAQLLFNKTMT